MEKGDKTTNRGEWDGQNKGGKKQTVYIIVPERSRPFSVSVVSGVYKQTGRTGTRLYLRCCLETKWTSPFNILGSDAPSGHPSFPAESSTNVLGNTFQRAMFWHPTLLHIFHVLPSFAGPAGWTVGSLR